MASEDELKGLFEELGRALTDAVNGDDYVAHVLGKIRERGKNAYIVLEGSVAFEDESAPGAQSDVTQDYGSREPAGPPPKASEAPRVETRPRPSRPVGPPVRLNLTPQDLKDLKALGIDPNQ